jgi:hypothetical protein
LDRTVIGLIRSDPRPPHPQQHLLKQRCSDSLCPSDYKEPQYIAIMSLSSGYHVVRGITASRPFLLSRSVFEGPLRLNAFMHHDSTCARTRWVSHKMCNSSCSWTADETHVSVQPFTPFPTTTPLIRGYSLSYTTIPLLYTSLRNSVYMPFRAEATEPAAYYPPGHFSFPFIPKLSLDIEAAVSNAILFLKRTFQPSLIRKKRKHGFLAR